MEDISLWAGKCLRQAAFGSITDVLPIIDKNNNLPAELDDSDNDLEADPEISNLTDSINPIDETNQ